MPLKTKLIKKTDLLSQNMIDVIIAMSSLETSASGLKLRDIRYKRNNIIFESFAIKSITQIGAKECKIKLQ